MLTILTGRNYLLEPALIAAARQRLSRAEGTFYVVVPRQLTLQTELTLIKGLDLRGSFRLQVLSPERLCGRIFDAAGRPEGTRVDDRGRVMLARAAAKQARGSLTLYKGAEQRRGFSERAARQLELVRQAGLSPEELEKLAEGQNGALAWKLKDLAQLLRAYDALIEGRFQDGETEFAAAAERAGQAAFLRDSELWFYGFDLMPPPLHALICAVAGACPETRVLLPLEDDPRASDADVFRPLQSSFKRLAALARSLGVPCRREALKENEGPDAPQRHPELRFLERALFAWPVRPWEKGAPRAIQLVSRKDPADEARFVAALARRLAQTRGFHWNDMLILCPDLDTYARPLGEAFAAYEVPLFLSTSRAASRHALAECLLTALACVSGNYRTEDVLTLLRTGYLDVDADEADRLANYATAYGIRGTAFLKPFTRGEQSLREALEPVRQRLARPLLRLRDALRAAEGLRGQLAAVFGFLTDIRAYEKSLERQKQLAAQGLRQLAGEEGQVWTRILGALDQMYALMGEKKLARAELTQLLRESLEAAVIKPLPQSGDAVSAQPLDRITARRARAVFLVGLTDRTAAGDEGLLSDAQRGLLSQLSGKYLGLSAVDTARARRFYVKTAVGMCTDYLCLSYPLSGADDTAERPDAVIAGVRALFPALGERGGLGGDEGLDRMLRGAPRAALNLLGRALASEEAELPADREALLGLAALPEARDGLARLASALDRRRAVDSLDARTAEALYGTLKKASITRLERFASCPFSHYVQYGLAPEVVEPYALTPQSEGEFFHSAVHDFLEKHARDLADFSEAEAEAAMDAIAERLLEELALGPLGENAVSRAERRRLCATARSAARVLREHLAGSGFRPSELEIKFGPDDDASRIVLRCEGGDCALEGRIDRIDVSEIAPADAPDGALRRYVRVIDYKRGNRAPDPAELFAGLQLQLPVYLGAAMRREQAASAGAFYFHVDEGLVNTPARDPDEVERLRRNQLRLAGIMPRDAGVISAMAAAPQEVFRGLTAKGAPHGASLNADARGFDLLVGHALERAREQIEGIRSGRADAEPARSGKYDPCAFCSWRGACLRDESLDARRVREVAPMKAAELMEALAGTEE